MSSEAIADDVRRTTDDGHLTITIAHHEPMAHGELKTTSRVKVNDLCLTLRPIGCVTALVLVQPRKTHPEKTEQNC